MKHLGLANVSLVPFPFGNTNSTVDALSLRIPTVFLVDEVPYDAGDVVPCERLGMFDALATCSISEYVEKAVKVFANGGVSVRIKLEEIDWSQVLQGASIQSEY